MSTATPGLLHPPGWAEPTGYAHGVSAKGRVIVTAGQVGWDPATGEFANEDFADQSAQALRNIVAVLASAGAKPEHLVRLTWFILDAGEYKSARRALGAAYREAIGAHYPAMTVVIVKGLLESQARVEIEATAVVPD
jgi:enamine deaminase RidA (YjgF/YER057c/UK114 family)